MTVPATTVTFTTKTGSQYELDETNRRIRRLCGDHEPTANQGPDTEWQTYLKVSPLEVGEELLIVWRMEGPIFKRTLTSPVVEINAAQEAS